MELDVSKRSMCTIWAMLLLFVTSAGAQISRAPSAAYVGSKTCKLCHSEIYSEYVKTSMGRSIVPAGEMKDLVTGAEPVTVRNGDITYEVLRRGNEIYQADYELDESGTKVFNNSYQLEYAVGSGVNGITFLVRKGNRLFEAPLSYYSRTKTWQLSPGYEHGNVGFSRPIPAACLTCHSGRSQPVRDRDGLYADPPFLELAVGCENCHGPGSEHVHHPGKATIVNPARLAPRLADDICMNCHQAGDVRVFQPGKTYSSFRPGTPLGHTVAIFKIPLNPAAGPGSNLLEHNFSMTLSKCYRATNGRMSCLTCHNPHAMPEKRVAAAYYEKKCLNCHNFASCKLPLHKRAQEAGGCIGCHMPKADVGFISHSALTNHRIVRTPDAPLPAIAFKQTTPDLPDLIYLDRIGNEPVPPIVLLEAYGELMGRAPEYKARYLKLLDTFAARLDNGPLVEAALGIRAFEDPAQGASRKAIDHLSKALHSGFTGPIAFEDLALALSNEGRAPDAIEILKRGIELSPYAPRLQKRLMVEYINIKRYDLAKAAMERYVELFPEDDFVRNLLRKAGG